MCCVKFDRRFAALTAQTFISELLAVYPRVLSAVGDDFRFALCRAGDFFVITEGGGGVWFCGFQHPNLL